MRTATNDVESFTSYIQPIRYMYQEFHHLLRINLYFIIRLKPKLSKEICLVKQDAKRIYPLNILFFILIFEEIITFYRGNIIKLNRYK